MGSDVSKDYFRGLLIPDPRLSSIWSAESSFTQADPQPGIPSAQGNYELSLTSSGSQGSNGQLRVRSQKPGHPGRSGSGAFVWKNEGDGNWRGWDVPNTITNYQSIVWTDGTGSTVAAKNPSVVALDDQTVVIAYHKQTSSAHQLVVQTMSPSSNTFGTAVVVYSQTSAPAASVDDSYHPCLLKLPGSRIVLYYQAVEGGNGVIKAYESTDNGASWSLASPSVLDGPISVGTATGSGVTTYEMHGMRAAYGGGQVLLMISTFSNNTDYDRQGLYTQYASDSAGLNFNLVEVGPYTTGSAATVAETMAAFNVVYQESAFVIPSGHYETGVGGEKIAISKIGSAFQKISSAVTVTTGLLNLEVLGDSTDVGGLAACVSDDGSIYVHVVGFANNGSGSTEVYGCVFVSTDGGDTVEDLGKSGIIRNQTYGSNTAYGPTGLWFNADNNSTHPSQMQSCFARGRVNILCNHIANPGNEDNSLTFITLGGSSTVTMPLVDGYYNNGGMGGFSETWLPFDLPGDTGTWTATSTGTQSLTDGRLQITTSGSQNVYYSSDLTTPVYTGGYIVRASLRCPISGGGALSADNVAIRMRLADGGGGDDYDVSVRFSSAGFRVYDNNGSAQVGTDVSITMSNEHEFIIAMLGGSVGQNDGKIQVWYRPKNSSSDRNWIKSTGGSALTDDTSSPASSSNITWGHKSSDATSTWTEFHVSRADSAGSSNIVDQANPAGVWSKPYAPSGYRSYVNAGTFITAHDGPARLSDQYNIDTRYGYAIDRIFFSESQTPRVEWRSTNVTENTIALAFDNTLLGTDDSKTGNDVIALTLLGINWKTGVLQGYDSTSTSWQTIANIDSALGLSSLDWSRDGNTVSPGSTAASTIFVHTNEFEGGTFGLQDGSGTNLRKIAVNTSGEWDGTAATTTKTPQFILEGVTGSDKSSGVLGYIMAPNVTVVAKLNGSKYAGYRLKINAQSTVDGYFTVGTAILGWVEAFGRQYSRGRIIETVANTSVVARTDGTSTSTNFGPAQRSVQFAWTDGVDVSSVQGSTPDPDYIKGHTAGGSLPIATPGETPYQIEGIVNMLDGPNKAVVYIPSISKSANPVVLNRRDQFIAGRIESPARLENVIGNEDVDPGEVFRVATVNIREIV
jgi:hypothetical protein